jgi:hypothetical protein
MFRTLVFRSGTPDPTAQNALFASSPAEIMALLELCWRTRSPALKSGVIKQAWEANEANFSPLTSQEIAVRTKFNAPSGPGDVLEVYSHAIESFCLENTRIVEIFRRVLGHFLYGEQLAVPPDSSASSSSTDIVSWLRVTESVFFSQSFAISPFSVMSTLRPSGDLVRRNLYYRMFGADLLHPSTESGSVEQLKPAASNRDFFLTFERLQAEVWRGLVNATNTSGRKDTDDAAIATMATRLCDTMRDRRLGGNLQREEFYASALLGWFNMAVAWNSPIVKALKAEADHPADRLARIGERVGLKAHVHSAAYIQMAPLAGTIMEAIETGTLNGSSTASLFYLPGAGSLASTMNELITLYMRATGRDIKAAAVTVSQRA